MEKYPHPIIDFTKYITPLSEIKKKAKMINACDLKRKIRIKNEKINTIGELKKYITNG